jgi:hypothetical protein
MENIRDLYMDNVDFKNSYHPRNNIAKVEKGDVVADYYSILVS